MPATVEIHLGLPGLTPLTCDIFPEFSDTPALSGVSLVEETNRAGVYTCAPNVTGWHTFKLYNNGVYFPAVIGLDIPASGTVSSASESGDPWETALPGSYPSGSAGYIVGNNLDQPVSSISLSSGISGTNTNSPIPSGGILSLRKGNDYKNADGRRQTFTVTVPGTWGGGTVSDCILRLRSGTVSVDITCAAISQTGNTLSMGFDIAASDFSTLPDGKPKERVREWEIFLNPGNGNNLTPIVGLLNIDPSVPAPT